MFKIQGPTVDEETLYWSNDLGWVDFDSATTFSDEECIRLPMEAEAVVTLQPDGTVETIGELPPLGVPFCLTA